MGMILVTASVAVFVWAVVGLIRPTWARLPSRAASVGVWVLSVVLFIIGGALMPDSTPEQTEQSAALGSQSVPPPTPEAAPAPDDGDWRTGRTTNALDDSPTVTAVLDAAQGVSGLLDSDPIQGIARCQSNKTARCTSAGMTSLATTRRPTCTQNRNGSRTDSRQRMQPPSCGASVQTTLRRSSHSRSRSCAHWSQATS